MFSSNALLIISIIVSTYFGFIWKNSDGFNSFIKLIWFLLSIFSLLALFSDGYKIIMLSFGAIYFGFFGMVWSIENSVNLFFKLVLITHSILVSFHLCNVYGLIAK